MSQKQVMPKSEDLSRSLEINAIWTFINVCIIKIHVPRAHEVKNQRVIAKMTSQIMKYGQDVIIQKRTDEDSLSEIALSGASKLASTYFTLFYRIINKSTSRQIQYRYSMS